MGLKCKGREGRFPRLDEGNFLLPPNSRERIANSFLQLSLQRLDLF